MRVQIPLRVLNINKMNKNEIKKALYKQKPKAEFRYIRNGVAYYKTILGVPYDEEVHKEVPFGKEVFFEIPVEDMGNADFEKEMDAQLLNRWIVSEEVVV